jgi:hypothetical protein
MPQLLRRRVNRLRKADIVDMGAHAGCPIARELTETLVVQCCNAAEKPGVGADACETVQDPGAVVMLCSHIKRRLSAS